MRQMDARRCAPSTCKVGNPSFACCDDVRTGYVEESMVCTPCRHQVSLSFVVSAARRLRLAAQSTKAALADGGALLPFCCTTVENRGQGLRIGRWDPKLQPTGILETSRSRCSDSGLNRLIARGVVQHLHVQGR